MKTFLKLTLLFIIAGLLFPNSKLLAVSVVSKEKTLTGLVTKTDGYLITFTTNSAAAYIAEVSRAKLARKNGAGMTLKEILVNDKVEVKGQVWPDNSISTTSLRNLSLYAHTGTFTGKITSLNPQNASFTIQSTANGTQTISTNSLTTFKKNGSAATFSDLLLGITAKVKGVWERKKSEVSATGVEATVRLVSIEINGQLFMKSPDLASITIVADNVIYGVDTTKAAIQNKSGKASSLTRFNNGDNIKVSGKHISGSNQITGSKIKNMSLSY